MAAVGGSAEHLGKFSASCTRASCYKRGGEMSDGVSDGRRHVLSNNSLFVDIKCIVVISGSVGVHYII